MDQSYGTQCAECSRLTARFDALTAGYVEASCEFLSRINTLNQSDYLKFHEKMEANLSSAVLIVRARAEHQREHASAMELRSAAASGR